MDVHQTTLSNLFDDRQESTRVLIEHGRGKSTHVLIEHGRCGAFLGMHKIYFLRGLIGSDLEPHVYVDRHLARARPNRRPGRNLRDPMTTPCVLTGYGDASRSDKHYAYVWCTCLPPGHEEKVGEEKLDELPVTFPHWKWGRAIDLPVLTI